MMICDDLFHAAIAGDVKKIEQLLAQGCDVNQPAGPIGRTPLQCAIWGNQVEAVFFLVSQGGYVSEDHHGWLHWLENTDFSSLQEPLAEFMAFWKKTRGKLPHQQLPDFFKDQETKHRIDDVVDSHERYRTKML